jgi:tetratricopeptide (TPR) repeat protein
MMRRFRYFAVALWGVGALSACVEPATEHRIRANALFKSGEYQAALEECQRGLGAKPDDTALLVLEGKTAFELGDLRTAEKAYEQAILVGNGRRGVFLGDAYLGLGVIASREQRWADARRRFLELLALAPADVASHANLAKVDLELGQIDEAVQHAEQAGRTQGNDEGILFTLGKVYVAAGRFDDAEKTFEHICQIVPGSSSCPYGVAVVATKRGDTARALAKLREAIDHKMPHPDKLGDEPAFGPLRGDPEFQALLVRATAAGAK